MLMKQMGYLLMEVVAPRRIAKDWPFHTESSRSRSPDGLG